MGKSYSLDLRERVSQFVSSGGSRRQAASHFDVSPSFAVKLWRRRAPGFIENGKILYTGLMRADSKVIDPTGGSVPPIVSARLHS